MTKLEKRCKEVDAKLKKLWKIRNDIENKIEKQEEPKYKQKIGSCYVFQNSYSDGKKWPLYIKIIGFENNSFAVFQFEKRSDDSMAMDIKDHFYRKDFDDQSYSPITQNDFNSYLQQFIEEFRKKGANI